MPGKIISGIVGIIGALWLGIAGAWAMHWWDTRPAGQPAWANVHFLWFHWSPPESIGARLVSLQAAEAAAAAHTHVVIVQQAQVSAQAAQHDAEAQTKIITVTRTIMKEVPVVLTPEVDRRYPLPIGFGRLHDAAALGVDLSGVPDAAGRPDDAPDSVTASQAASIIVDNYGACHVTTQRLIDLQAWVRDEAAAQR